MHPDYEYKGDDSDLRPDINDIALLKLSEKVTFIYRDLEQYPYSLYLIKD